MGKISQNEKTLMALSGINNLLTAIWEVIRDRIPALSNGKIPVDGTFWQSTQPVSIATSPAGLAYVC